MKRYIVGVSGASGMPIAKILLKALHQCPDVEIHLIVSKGAIKVLETEPPEVIYAEKNDIQTSALSDLTKYAHVIHDVSDMGAGPASGSWRHSGMIVCPCSMSSLASIASGAAQNLIHRTADVCIKEKTPLVIVPRETPLSTIHLQNMLSLSKIGVTIMPPCPAFYGKTYNLEKILEHFVARALDQLKIVHNLGFRWKDD